MCILFSIFLCRRAHSIREQIMTFGQKYELAPTNGKKPDTEMGTSPNQKSCLASKATFILQCIIIACLLFIIVIMAIFLAKKNEVGKQLEKIESFPMHV